MNATHLIDTGTERINVIADLDGSGDGPLYTQEEWDSWTRADWEINDGRLQFQGKDSCATIRALG